MTSRKRPAPEPLLPVYSSKQPRRALKGANGEIASPSEAQGLLSKWLSLASTFLSLTQETVGYFIPTSSVDVAQPPTSIREHPATSLAKPRKRFTTPGRVPESVRPQMPGSIEPLSPAVPKTLIPALPHASLGPPSPPSTAGSKAHDLPRCNIQPPVQLDKVLLDPPQGTSEPLQPTSIRDRYSEPHPPILKNATHEIGGNLPPHATLESERADLRSVAFSEPINKHASSSNEDGIRRNYKNRPHILIKAHKAHVQAERTKNREELIRTLYEIRQASGYKSDFQTFKGYLQYGQLVDSLAQRDALSSPRSLTDLRAAAKDSGESRRHSFSYDDTTFLERAIEKARRTLSGPKPPPPFLPSFEKMKLTQRNKDEAIERRLRSSKPLPLSLPPADEERVNVLLKRKGLISKFAKEQVMDHDLSRLLPGHWLNDEIINFYGAMIMARSEDAKENKKGRWLNVYYFSTFFWAKLSKEGYEKGRLAKWTKKIDIFSKDVALIPVNHGNAHWTGAVINFRHKRIESYDSMGYKRDEVYRILRAYIDAEHRNKKNAPFDFSGWEDYFSLSTPQQENGYDCGVFTCQFLESISRGEDAFSFTQRDMPYLRRCMIWEIGHSKLRDDR